MDTPFLIHSLEIPKRLKSFSPTLERELWISGPLCITLPRVTNVQKREDFFARLRVTLIVCVSSRLFPDRLAGLQTRGKFFFIFLLGERSVKLCIG